MSVHPGVYDVAALHNAATPSTTDALDELDEALKRHVEGAEARHKELIDRLDALERRLEAKGRQEEKTMTDTDEGLESYLERDRRLTDAVLKAAELKAKREAKVKAFAAKQEAKAKAFAEAELAEWREEIEGRVATLERKA